MCKAGNPKNLVIVLNVEKHETLGAAVQAVVSGGVSEKDLKFAEHYGGSNRTIITGLGNVDEMFKGGLEKGKVSIILPAGRSPFATHRIGLGKSMFLENIKMNCIIKWFMETMYIPCECNTGSMVRITDVHDDDVGKYRCTGCGITKERI